MNLVSSTSMHDNSTRVCMIKDPVNEKMKIRHTQVKGGRKVDIKPRTHLE